MSENSKLVSWLSSPSVKLFLIGALVLVLTIPLIMVYGILTERQSRAWSVESEIAGSWGGAQSLAGPFLILPFTSTERQVVDNQSRDVTVKRYAVLLPETLKIEGQAKSDVLRRSLFDVTVYRAQLTLTGRFAAPELAGLVRPETVLWDEAMLVLSVSDVRAFKDQVQLVIPGGKPLSFEPSAGPAGAGTGISGIHLTLPAVTAKAGFDFTIPLTLNGSQSLGFAPAGRATEAELSSDWPHPSFTGAFLPDRREISGKGFSASWAVPHLARNVPQRFLLPDYGLNALDQASFGVRFYQPVDFYQLVERALKYAPFFIAAVFVVAFLLETLSGRRVHMAQYLFIGMAQVIFYLLLLAFSEQIGFTGAYALGAGATIGLVGLYAGIILKGVGRGLLMLVTLMAVYGLLYLLLRLEDYALLAGALAAFFLLAVTMFATLKVNWRGTGSG
jgi:inner membrane protein